MLFPTKSYFSVKIIGIIYALSVLFSSSCFAASTSLEITKGCILDPVKNTCSTTLKWSATDVSTTRLWRLKNGSWAWVQGSIGGLEKEVDYNTIPSEGMLFEVHSGATRTTPLARLRVSPIDIPDSSGAYVMMHSYDACHSDVDTDCYLNNEVAAENTVRRLSDIGTKYFLLPSSSVANSQILRNKIVEYGAYYYTYEGWNIDGATDNSGVFDCDDYESLREQDFLTMKAQHGSHFKGIMASDEPSTDQFANLKKFRDCVKESSRYTEIRELDIFLSLPCSQCH